MQNICLYISRMKTRPLTWRNSHPFVLVDRLEDITDRKEVDKDPNCKREVSLYLCPFLVIIDMAIFKAVT